MLFLMYRKPLYIFTYETQKVVQARLRGVHKKFKISMVTAVPDPSETTSTLSRHVLDSFGLGRIIENGSPVRLLSNWDWSKNVIMS